MDRMPDIAGGTEHHGGNDLRRVRAGMALLGEFNPRIFVPTNERWPTDGALRSSTPHTHGSANI